VGSIRFRETVQARAWRKAELEQEVRKHHAGGRGARVTYNTNGQRTTSVGLPGTGLSYRDTRRVGSKTSRAQPVTANAARAPQPPVWGSEVNGTALAITFGGNNYDRWVSDGTGWRQAGQYGASYFDARAAADRWAAYLRNGGTVSAWTGSY
jgi:hypothetical protein